METTARVRPGAGTVLGTFFYMWLLVGLVLGTVLLLGPLRLITETMGRAGWQQGSRDRMLILVMLLYVVLSALITRWIVGVMFRTRNRNTRWGIAAVFTMLAALTSWEWSNPARLLARISDGADSGSYTVSGGARFIFGSYPDEGKLRELRTEGVTSVISLQHPRVPFETAGFEAEAEAARKLRLALVHLPMRPWSDDNGAALDELRMIEDTAKGGVFYVHSGVGGDRLSAARRLIETEGKRIALSGGIGAVIYFADRTRPLKRGSLARIDDGKWLIPYPAQDEMFSLVLGGQAGTVVSLLDPLDPQQAAWNTEMERLFKQNSVPFVMRPLHTHDPADALGVAKEVHEMRRPVTVIVPATPGEDGRPRADTQIALTFLKAYARVSPKSLAARPSWRLTSATTRRAVRSQRRPR